MDGAGIRDVKPADLALPFAVRSRRSRPVKTPIRLASFASFAFAWVCAGAALAQTYPTHPISCSCPGRRARRPTWACAHWSPTSSCPSSASRSWVDNRPGAGGVVGSEVAAKSPRGRLHAPRGLERTDLDQPQRAESRLRAAQGFRADQASSRSTPSCWSSTRRFGEGRQGA